MSQSTLTAINSKFGITVHDVLLTLTSVGFTTAEIELADEVLFTVEVKDVRYSVCETITPTTTSGHLMPIGETRIIGCDLIRNLKFIRDDTNDSIVDITLFKR